MEYPYKDHIQMTLHLMETAYNELDILFRPRSPEEIKLVGSHTLSTYMLSLHYMFVNEFCKLMEFSSKREGVNVASLMSWNDFLVEHYEKDFAEKFELNKQLFTEIRTSEIYTVIKSYRDKRFSHIDSVTGDPYNISFLNESQMSQTKQILAKLKTIVDNCTILLGYEFSYEITDNQTDNFIRYHAQYQQFYFNNHLLAYEQGFY